MTSHPIMEKWPAQHPERLQLYSLPTPNGVKISIALEETGLPYEVHRVDFGQNEQKSDAFLSLNPNGKIPAILDPDGPGGTPIGLWESGAILDYLAQKTGKLLPDDPAQRWQARQWLHFQIGGIGPMFGQLGYFYHFDGKQIEDKRPLERYQSEARRLLGVLNGHLQGRDWVVDDYSIADIAIFPWVHFLLDFYKAGDLVEFDQFSEVSRVLEAFRARPAVKRGLEIPGKG